MKINLNRCGMWVGLGLLLASPIMISAVPITFRVNLQVQTALGNFNPDTDTVVAAGTFDNWSTSELMLTNSPANTTVYAGTYDDTTDTIGGTVQYKFIIQSAANGTVWEGIDNRTATLAGSDQTLPIVYFNNLTNASSGVPITFQVDMAAQIALGNFDPASDTVIAAGTFDNWSTSAFQLSPSPTAPSVYAGTFIDKNDAPGNVVQYKFIINGSNWESINNRTVTLASSKQTLPVVYFNNVTNSGVTTIPVTYQVNLAVQTALGNFNPVTDTVIAAGTFNNWSTSAFQLTNSPAAPNIYSGTFNDTTDAPGTPVQYKFIINGSNWESIGNRMFTLASTSQALPLVYFNDAGSLGSLLLKQL